MTTETFAHLALAIIEPSLTNPRKTFDATKLAELAESITATGVHQPVLVRPLPASRVADTAQQSPRPEYELVSGERRYRACTMAGLAKIPAMVRALTDEQVLEIQLVENLQRDDLQPLEEAEGYEHLMQSHEPPHTVQQVAGKIGKSTSYVYARLKLLNLGPEGRAALREGRLDASRALLIARIPDTKLQAAALGNMFNSYTQEPISYREAAALLQRQYMLRLAEARFKITDATLVPAAGNCRECPKRTGADPDLFADVKGADVCTDPACFKAKDQAHADRELAKAQANGQTIITGREAKSLMPSAWDTRIDGHLRLDDAQDSPTGKPLRALIGKQMEKDGIKPLLVANPHKEGELIAVLPRETVSQLLAAKGYQEQADKVQEDAQRSAKSEAEAVKRKRTTAFEEGWRWRLMEKAWSVIASDHEGRMDYLIPEEAVRYLALQKARSLNQDKAKRLCKLLELGTVAPMEAMKDWVADTDPHMSLALLTMHEDAEYCPWLPDDKKPNAALLAITADADVSADVAKAEVKAELAAKWKAQDTAAKARADKQEKGDPPLAPAAQASGVRGKGTNGSKGPKTSPAAPGAKKPKAKPKTTAQEAMRGIAAAMQGEGEEDAPGAGRTGTNPDGASAVGEGEEGRATSPDAGAYRMPEPVIAWPFPKGAAP
jgi:ParB/RepB/Spo0J family partition protein